MDIARIMTAAFLALKSWTDDGFKRVFESIYLETFDNLRSTLKNMNFMLFDPYAV